MLSIQESKTLFHRVRPDGKTVEFSLGKIDDLVNEALAAIPFDSPTDWEGWQKECIEKGLLDTCIIKIDGEPQGIVTYVVTGTKQKELLISHAYIRNQNFDFIPLLTVFAKKLAKENGCKFVRFHTARKGLVKKALEQGFHVSEIVCRLTL